MTRSRPQPPRARVSEKQEQAAIVDLLRAIGATVYVIGTKRRKGDHQGTMQTPGIPDLFAFLPLHKAKVANAPTFVWIEVKRTGGKCSAAQIEFERNCLDRNVWHFIGGHDAFANLLKVWGFLK